MPCFDVAPSASPSLSRATVRDKGGRCYASAERWSGTVAPSHKYLKNSYLQSRSQTGSDFFYVTIYFIRQSVYRDYTYGHYTRQTFASSNFAQENSQEVKLQVHPWRNLCLAETSSIFLHCHHGSAGKRGEQPPHLDLGEHHRIQ
jgi:hypothetical protein